MQAAIFSGMPSCKMRPRPPPESVIPPRRPDAGGSPMAGQFGCRQMICVKHGDGLDAAHPKTSPGAAFVPRVSVGEMKEPDLHGSIPEFPALDLLRSAQHGREGPVVNGRGPGNLARGPAGAHAGTIITAR